MDCLVNESGCAPCLRFEIGYSVDVLSFSLPLSLFPLELDFFPSPGRISTLFFFSSTLPLPLSLILNFAFVHSDPANTELSLLTHLPSL